VTLKAGDLVAEVTTLREDVETDGRHAVVRFGIDWSKDASRRDFTMNALYVGGDGALFDPLKGLGDCIAGRVRFIGDPDQRIAEDRLRVFRFFRFCASHGRQRFDEAGYLACARAAGDLGALSAERVGAEMIRILALPKVAVTLGKMVDAGVLALPCNIETQAHYEKLARVPTASGRLALMLHGGNGVRFSTAWRLANRTFADAEAVLSAARLSGGRRGPDRARDVAGQASRGGTEAA
jgi:poly(A) polymerase